MCTRTGRDTLKIARRLCNSNDFKLDRQIVDKERGKSGMFFTM